MKSLIFVITALFALPALADFTIIVNTATGVSSLSSDQLTNILSASTTKVGSQKTKIFYIKGSAATKAALGKAGMTEPEFENVWLEKALSGAGQPPKEVGSSAEIVSGVKGNSGGIGILPKADEGSAGGTTVVTVQ